MIRQALPADLPDLTRLYCDRLKGSLYTRLGPAFVGALLAGILGSPEGRVLVAGEEQTVQGFIAAATNAQALFRRFRRERGLSLLWRALPRLLVDFSMLREALRTGRYFALVGEREIEAELLYIAIQRDLQGTKLASKLLAAMLWELHRGGAKAVKVTTELENKPPQDLLGAFGFERRHTFRFYGKEMVVLVHPDLEHARREAF